VTRREESAERLAVCPECPGGKSMVEMFGLVGGAA
jgi:hypothetical protein